MPQVSELWLTNYQLPDLLIGNTEKKYRSHYQEIERVIILV